MFKNSFIPLLALVISFTGCVNNESLYAPQKEEKLTVAKAQNELKAGMSSAKVIEIMGSPNIISTNDEGNEVWVYDKVSTQNASQSGSIGTGFIPSLLVGGNSSSSSSASSQRTLTIIIKYDKNKKVKDIAYHTSRF